MSISLNGPLNCGITGKEILPGDEFVWQDIPAEKEGQLPYRRAVLLSALKLSEEEIEQLRKEEKVITAAE